MQKYHTTHTHSIGLGEALAERCAQTEHALDVGCGSGQLSVLLAERFTQVTATDPSAGQLESAKVHSRVTYRQQPAEQIGTADTSVDLITAAQAAHWFDLPTFYEEVRRVARTDARLALVPYGVPSMEARVDERLHQFYWRDIHAFWPDGRQHVENGYQSLSFPFDEHPLPPISITRAWSFAQMIAYLCTWSASRRALAAGKGALLDTFVQEFGALWGDPKIVRSVTWPVVGRLGQVHMF